MEPVDVPTHIWCVSNPVGGGGKGRQLTEALTILLRRRFPALQVHSGIAANNSTAPFNEDRPSGVVVVGPEEDANTHHGGGASSLPTSSCNIHYTGGVGDGSRIARDVLSPRIQALLDENPQHQGGMRRHFVVVIGGDGTLSEVIDGLCRGLLEDPQGHVGCCAFTTCCQRRDVAQQRLGRLPTIVYLAGGTGADFARLGYCCTTPEDAFSVLTSSRLEALAGMTPNSIEDRANVSNTSSSEVGGGGTRPSGSSDATIGKPCNSRVRTPTHAKVDIGTVTFMNQVESPTPSSSGEPQEPSYPQFRHQYFINEVSVGLSSAVVQRAEKLKSSCLSYLGGSAVFLGAGAIELLRMTPRPIRVRQVMDLEDPINRHSPSCTHSTAATPSPPQHQQPSTTALEQSERWSEGSWVNLATTALVFGNGQYFGGGMKVCPQGNLFDQRLSITSWGESTCGFLFGFPSIYTGRASTSWASSRMFTGQRVVVEVDGSLVPKNAADADKMEEFALMEADGEPLSRLPALVETCLGIRFAFLR